MNKTEFNSMLKHALEKHVKIEIVPDKNNSETSIKSFKVRLKFGGNIINESEFRFNTETTFEYY